jgi:hypothetical protein
VRKVRIVARFRGLKQWTRVYVVSMPWVTNAMATGLARELPGEAVRVRQRKSAEATLVSTTRLTRDRAREARRSALRGAWADDAGNQLWRPVLGSSRSASLPPNEWTASFCHAASPPVQSAVMPNRPAPAGAAGRHTMVASARRRVLCRMSSPHDAATIQGDAANIYVELRIALEIAREDCGSASPRSLS